MQSKLPLDKRVAYWLTGLKISEKHLIQERFDQGAEMLPSGPTILPPALLRSGFI